MKKKILVAVFMVMLLCGCEKTIPKLSNGNEAVVSFKNEDYYISVEDLYARMKNSYALNVIVDMIDTKILDDKYSDKKEDAADYAKSSLESVKTYYTDENGKFDEESLISDLNQYYGYTALEQYEEALKLNYLRNFAIEDYAKSQVKESDIKKYYKEEIVGDREVSHILIIPEATDSMTSDEKAEAEDKALETAKDIIARLKKGEKFEDLAREYSSDEATKEKGGSLGYINKGTYGSTEFDNEVYALKVGNYSKTPVKTSEGYEIVYVTAEKDKQELDEVRDTIIKKLADDNLSNDSTLSVVALRELRKEYGVEIVDDEIEASYNKYMNNLYNQALENNSSK